MCNKIKLVCMTKMIVLLSVLQLSLFILKKLFFIFFERTNFTDRIASMMSMIILGAIVIFIAKKRSMKLSIMPDKFNSRYIFALLFFLLILIFTPSNFSGNIQNIILLIYSAIIVPVYEEVIFRGLIWNYLEHIYNNKITVYIVNALLFGLWHLGYVSSLAFRISDGLINAMFWKVITGLIFGLILGLLRLKTKNCFSTMLLHGLMNIFTP